MDSVLPPEITATHGSEALIDERTLARLTGRSVPSIRRDRQLKIGVPYAKIGNAVRYRPADVRAFIERCMVRTEGQQ